MNGVDSWFFPSTRMTAILRNRPMAITVFEKHALDPWDPVHPGIAEACAQKHVPLDAFHEDLKGLAVPDRESDWKNLPIFHLIDFLSHDHRHFREAEIPVIDRTLAKERAVNGKSLRRLEYLFKEWPAFSDSLLEHIREEEEYLFPKILRLDYRLRHKIARPDLSGGSVNVFVSLRMLGNEKKQMAIVRRFLNEALFSQAAAPRDKDSFEGILVPLMESLQEKLLEHSSLETNTLFPMAKEMERAMLDSRIAGAEAGDNRTSPPFRLQRNPILKRMNNEET